MEKGDSLVESCSWLFSLWSFAKIRIPLLHNVPQQVNFSYVEIHQTQIQSETQTCVRMTLPSLLFLFNLWSLMLFWNEQKCSVHQYKILYTMGWALRPCTKC